ncbi:hypothetical protein [Natrinema sp. DC36]|uniref:hypothetical protein n=1 Tax=Natrinema sp. DC36 TaxID=2878680 RepID=UPI001CF050C2|nr:hypothetical protein [Natrinema sp. DC36]
MANSERREEWADRWRVFLGALLIVMAIAVFILESQQSGATTELITNTLETILEGVQGIEEGTS